MAQIGKIKKMAKTLRGSGKAENRAMEAQWRQRQKWRKLRKIETKKTTREKIEKNRQTIEQWERNRGKQMKLVAQMGSVKKYVTVNFWHGEFVCEMQLQEPKQVIDTFL